MCNPYRDQLFPISLQTCCNISSLLKKKKKKKTSFNRATNKETPQGNEQIQIMGQDN